MAKRENQGLHIALISFVILSVLLIVTTYYFWSRSRHLMSEVEREKTAKTEANAAKNTAVLEAEKLKSFIGYTSEIPIDQIEQEFSEQMLTYGGSLPEVQRNYTELPKHLMATIQQRHTRIAELSSELRTNEDEFNSRLAELKKSLDEALQQLAQKESEVGNIDQTASTAQSNLRSQLSQQATKYDEQIAALKSDISQKQAELDGLAQERDKLKVILEDREKTIAELTNENNFDTPDGRIRFVNAKTRTVFLNLGAADGLRRQITFSVFGSDINNLYKEEPKGRIEVVRIIDDHTSEARIVDDYIDDPIVSGDVVYTPIWNANSALRFALLGKLDIDGDGKDDRERFKNMIALNHGKIDAEDVDGELQGRITRNTRYLVVDGDAEDDGESTAEANKIRDIRSQMLNDATLLGVEIVELDRILEYMGYSGDRRVIPLGKRARAEDFRAKPLDGVSRKVRPTSDFRARRVPGATN